MLMPISLVLILFFIAILLYKNNSKVSYRCLISGTILLLVSSLSPISDPLMESLESDYMPYQKTNTQLDYIIVLGCYHFSDTRLPATMQLKTCSLQRLVEAIRIAGLHPEAKIIMSGSAGHNPESNAEKMKEAAILMGLDKNRIFTENFPRDTEDEAELIAPRVKDSQVALITNADHMRRSINYFKAKGVNAIAAPASYWVKGNVKRERDGFDWGYYTPNSHAFVQSTVYWYETLGLVAQWFKGLFKDKEEVSK